MTYFDKHYSAPGAPPGTLLASTAPGGRLHLSLIEYDRDVLEARDSCTLTDAREFLDTPSISWIHAQGDAEPEVLRQLGQYFGLHALAMEDVLNAGQRPKAEAYENQLFTILRLPLLRDGRLCLEQVSLFVGRDFLVSFATGAQDPFGPVRARLKDKNSPLRAQGTDALLHALLDLVIDLGFPVLETYGERIEQLEEQLLVAQPEPTVLQDVHAVRRDLMQLRRGLWPQRELLQFLLREPHPLLHDAIKPYLRDTYDHVAQLIELGEHYREILSSLLDLYLSAASHRLNSVIRVLTMIATLFIPPTFLVGVYGMNFDTELPGNMPELKWPYGYVLVWTVILAVMIGMLVFFRRKRWL